MAQATPTPFPGQEAPGRNVPPPAPAPVPQFNFSIPAPRRGPVPRAVDEIEFDVSDIKIDGSTIFKPEAFQPLIAPLVGHKAKLSDIIAVADKVEAMYRDRGYVLTRAYVPPQTVSNGVFHISVVEGYVKATSVTGGNEMLRRQVEGYIAPVTQQKPAQLGTMERGLLLANDLPGTAASGLVRPSPTEPGASDLVVDLRQNPWDVIFYGDNRGAETTGQTTLGAQFVANNLVYIPGQFTFDVSGTPDFAKRNLFQAHYVRPVGFDGAALTLAGVIAHGSPTGVNGSASQLTSDSYSLSGHLSYPLTVSRALRISVAGGVSVQGEQINANANGLGSLCASGDDHWRDVDVSVTVDRPELIGASTTGATFGITQGIPGFGASTTPFCDIGEDRSLDFTKLTLVVQHTQPIYGPVSAAFNALGQYGFERLVIGEQTSFGGSGIGRGYDPASLAADSGLGLSSELRYDLHVANYHIDTLQFYGFFDVARTWNHNDTNSPDIFGRTDFNTIASTGIGVRVALLQMITSGIEFAHELKGVANNDNGRKTSRVLFNTAIRF